ncbi:sodium-dependent glucose transporter 1 [Scleropages formosus]|uniref:Major facilitator superfamily domain containing 4B n=1 Tax=Scleropages formosus TaxID=113540 RepID=A0A8C9V8L0_SCLFO|nr:sodium-dependent glucose transporter 1 [Scleropages formosus]
MSAASAPQQPAGKKKQVRFARMGGRGDPDDQDEDTLFDKRKDTKGALKSVMKRGRSRVDGSPGGPAAGGPAGVCGRWMITVALCASFLGLGMSISVLGPTFGDLATNVKQNISNISYIFVGRSTGYIWGSVLAGFLFDIMNHHLLLGFSMLLTAFGMIAVPFCKKALLLTLLMSSVGVSMGFLDTGGNVLILNTWGDRAGPHMQALHFSFAAGAFASPIIAKLLFGGDEHSGETNILAPKGDQLPTPTLNSSGSPMATFHHMSLQSIFHFTHSEANTLKSMWAYIVIGSFVLLVSLLFFIMYSRSNPLQDTAKATSGKQLVAKHHNALILLLFFFFFWYVGAEVAYGSFIYTYAKDYIHLDTSQAAGVNSLFWGTFAATRGLAIFFAACMRPGTMIVLSLLGCVLSSLLLSLFSRNKVILWSCTALYGASMATTFPSGISWVEQYTTVTGRSAAVFVVGAALGEMVLPALVGFLLGKVQDHPVLMYLSLATAAITSIIFPVMYKLATSPSGSGRKPRDKGISGADDREYCQALLDTGAEEEDEEDEEDEADQWNDADFEVIEMDDASLINSPNKSVLSASTSTVTLEEIPATPATSDLSAEAAIPSAFSVSISPQRRQLVAVDREKRD